MSHSKALSGPTVGDRRAIDMSTWARRNGIDKFEQERNVPIEAHSFWIMGRKSMKRTFALILGALAAAALFGGLVHGVLVAAHVSEPAATTVHGLPPQRLCAATADIMALVGVIIGGRALARPISRFGTASGRLGAIVALVAGLIAVVNGGVGLGPAHGGAG